MANASRKTTPAKRPKATRKTRAAAKAKPAAKQNAPVTRTAKQDNPQPVEKPVLRKLPNIWRLTRTAADILWQHKALFVTITLVYGLLNLLLVRGLASATDVGSIKQDMNQLFRGQLGGLSSGVGVFVVLLGSSGNNSSSTAGAYQLFLGVITTLAIVWALRKVFGGTKIRARDAFYHGMYPLIPFILVLLVVLLDFLPMLIGGVLYTIVTVNGIAVNGFETLIFAGISLLLISLSFYLLCSGIMALYIVTLPEMTPLKALRSARDLVRGRRWSMIRKILWLPVVLLLVACAIMLPIIAWLTPLAQWVFFVLTMFGLTAANTYMYVLYRELLNE
jgi:hypothetical protein